MQYLIEKYYDNIGWREGAEQSKLLEIMRLDEERSLLLQTAEGKQNNLQYREASVYEGNVLLLLRHGQKGNRLPFPGPCNNYMSNNNIVFDTCTIPTNYKMISIVNIIKG